MGQVASVRAVTALSPDALARALNGFFPRDLAIREIAEVPADWDALREARGKHYRYQIWNGACRSPLRIDRFHWLREPLDVERMREAAPTFVGTHDFAALRAERIADGEKLLRHPAHFVRDHEHKLKKSADEDEHDLRHFIEAEEQHEDRDECQCGAFIDNPDLAEWCADCGELFCSQACFEKHVC